MKFFALEDGRRLTYREAGEGPPLVLLHGWSMSSTVFSEAFETLSDRFRVFAPDLRGHGESDRGDGYGFGDFAADLARWFEALDLDGAALAGWSLGGQVAIELRTRVPERIARMILISSTPRFTAGDDWEHGLPAAQVRSMDRNLRRDYRRTMEEFFALQFAGEALPRARYRRIVEFAVRAGCLPEPEVARAALATLHRGDQRALLKAVDCPVLVMHGELDRITPPGAGRCVAEQIPGARLELFPGVGHAPFLSRPQEAFALWREFCL